jgi:hypothetical protein
MTVHTTNPSRRTRVLVAAWLGLAVSVASAAPLQFPEWSLPVGATNWQMAANADGRAVIAWVEKTPAGETIGLRRWSVKTSDKEPSAWAVEATAARKGNLAMQLTKRGDVFLLWQEVSESHPSWRLLIVDQDGKHRAQWAMSGMENASSAQLVRDARDRLQAAWVQPLPDNRCALHWVSVGVDAAPSVPGHVFSFPGACPENFQVTADGQRGILFSRIRPDRPGLMAIAIDDEDKAIWEQEALVAQASPQSQLVNVIHRRTGEWRWLWMEASGEAWVWKVQDLDAAGKRRWADEGLTLRDAGRLTDQTAGAMDAEGSVILAWPEAEASGTRVHVAWWLPETLGGPPLEESGLLDHVRLQKLTAAGRNRWWLVWVSADDDRRLGGTLWRPTPPKPARKGI